MSKYPTEWMYGHPKGSIRKYKDIGFIAIITKGSKQKSKYFTDYDTLEDAKQEAENYIYQESKKNGTLTNEIRYINKDTIEVKLTQGQIMKTDSKFIDIVKNHKLAVRKKVTKKGDIYYPIYRKKGKNTNMFSKLICNFNNIKYINNDTLDNRLCNLMERGIINDDINAEKQYSYFQMAYNKLPHNIWLLGKPSGSIFQKNGKNIWTCAIKSKNCNHSKTFSFTKENKDKKLIEAKIWQYEISYKLGLTTNLIKILNNNVIEVKIKDDITMKTDFNYIDIIQKYSLLLVKNRRNPSQTNVVMIINGKNKLFHSYISEYKITTHADGDTMNNCVSNLIKASVVNNNKR